MNFRENFKKDMKKCDHHIADLRKQLASRYAAVEKVRPRVPGWEGPAGGEGAGNQQGLRVPRQRLLSPCDRIWRGGEYEIPLPQPKGRWAASARCSRF